MVENIREVYWRYGVEPVENAGVEYTDALAIFPETRKPPQRRRVLGFPGEHD